MQAHLKAIWQLRNRTMQSRITVKVDSRETGIFIRFSGRICSLLGLSAGRAAHCQVQVYKPVGAYATMPIWFVISSLGVLLPFIGIEYYLDQGVDSGSA